MKYFTSSVDNKTDSYYVNHHNLNHYNFDRNFNILHVKSRAQFFSNLSNQQIPKISTIYLMTNWTLIVTLIECLLKLNIKQSSKIIT